MAAYRLLGTLGVPTLRVLGAAGCSLLLEDLSHSPAWRAATEEDVALPRTGTALAMWYRTLHEAGASAVTGPHAALAAHLRREVDDLTPEAVATLADALGERGRPVWLLAEARVERLRWAYASLPQTLNYNDFFWGNLALSRRDPLGAVVFDYHLLGVGVRYSDYRNVVGSLGPRAAAAFAEAYGPHDPAEQALDEPLATLYALSCALRLPRLPGWAKDSLREVHDGTLERRLRAAVERIV